MASASTINMLQSAQAALAADAAALEVERETLASERRALDTERERMTTLKVAPDDQTTLNIGGTLLTTQRATLTETGDSLLSAMFSGRWEGSLARDTAGHVFLDEDPELFRRLLLLLRQKKSRFDFGAAHTQDPGLVALADVYLLRDHLWPQLISGVGVVVDGERVCVVETDVQHRRVTVRGGPPLCAQGVQRGDPTRPYAFAQFRATAFGGGAFGAAAPAAQPFAVPPSAFAQPSFGAAAPAAFGPASPFGTAGVNPMQPGANDAHVAAMNHAFYSWIQQQPHFEALRSDYAVCTPALPSHGVVEWCVTLQALSSGAVVGVTSMADDEAPAQGGVEDDRRAHGTEQGWGPGVFGGGRGRGRRGSGRDVSSGGRPVYGVFVLCDLRPWSGPVLNGSMESQSAGACSVIYGRKLVRNNALGPSVAHSSQTNFHCRAGSTLRFKMTDAQNGCRILSITVSDDDLNAHSFGQTQKVSCMILPPSHEWSIYVQPMPNDAVVIHDAMESPREP
jgi:hypothetical protein